MNPEIRVRFAPSPTGYLHVGGGRTALFNWLFARHQGGKFVLRIEDTDKARNTPEAVAVILDGLRWLGLDWDEGPGKGGDYGPYFQSEREAVYERYFQKLLVDGHLYEDNGAWRFRSQREVVTVDDIVCGSIAFDLSNAETHPDMTIRRPDGSWIFHFVNVVDDIEMRISHVIRGEDHLSNTPKHLELFKALGCTPPAYAHIPLILNKDGSKMSKRDAGASISGYIDGGFRKHRIQRLRRAFGTPEALDAVLALVREKVKTLAEVPNWLSYFFTEQYPFDPQAVAKAYATPVALDRLAVLTRAWEASPEWDAAALEAVLKQVAGELGAKPNELLLPTRVAVSGRASGPNLFPMLEVLGRARTLARLKNAHTVHSNSAS
ncbi:MAG: glutamate--tRNA ligase [Verrucomicrobia bacterium]|nr:glutamate--tRNA ligase [Verrucomicrobiota bacterium]